MNYFEAMGDRRAQAQVLRTLCQLDADLGDYAAALTKAERCLALCEALGDVWGQVFLLAQLGDLRQAIGQVKPAWTYWRQALTLAADRDHPLTPSLQARLAQT